MALDGEVGTVPWTIKGELILNCNCTVFCPCVVSLGKHPAHRRLLPGLGRGAH